MNLTPEVVAALSIPFSVGAIGWKIQKGLNKDEKTGKPTRAIVVAFIDARDVMERLDQVVGAENWSDAYTLVEAPGTRLSVECRLTVCGITKADVGTGTKNSRDDNGDNLAKGAYSDALKRAAVKFGVGRFLYDFGGPYFVDLDSRQQFTPPTLRQDQTFGGNRAWVVRELTQFAKTHEIDNERIGPVVKELLDGRLVESLSLLATAELIAQAKERLIKETP
jgi:hypothetical protein